MSKEKAAQNEEHSHDDHPPINYGKIYKWLVVLFIISITGPVLEIKWLTILTAFGIAAVKANLVVSYFMHLKFEKIYINLLMITCLVFLMILFTFVAPDVLKHEGANWENTRAVPEYHYPEVESTPVPEPAGGSGFE